MADSKISALPAVAAVAAANEFVVNEAGASKKATAQQIRDYVGLTLKALSADLANATVSFAKVTNLDLALGAGTYVIKYYLRYQSDTTTTGIKFAVNFTGTFSSWVADSKHQAAAPDQTVITLGAVQGGASRAPSATVALVQTPSVDTINADMFMELSVLAVLTGAGTLELYHASEVATTTTVKQNSALIVTKVA